jgi:hypothetical protein
MYQEQFLQMFVRHFQDNWVPFLPLAKFAYNNCCHATMGFSPFYLTRGYYPCANFLKNHPSHDTTFPFAKLWATEAKDRFQTTHILLEHARASMMSQTNKKHMDHPFKVGDMVWLCTTNSKHPAPVRSLTYEGLAHFASQPRSTWLFSVWNSHLMSAYIWCSMYPFWNPM